MSPTGAYLLAVVCEADGDHRVATGLADRVFCGEVDWIEPESLDLHRSWQGLGERSSHLEWHEVPGVARQQGIKAHGHFRDEPGAPDAGAARLALLLLASKDPRPDAVVLVRDSDGQEERRTGLHQARKEREWPFAVAIGVAHPKRESWLLAGFEPQGDAESRALSELHEELRFDPRLEAERLRAKSPGAARSAKRVLERLLGGLLSREEACWKDSDLETLRMRGLRSGLADYLEEVRTRVVPLFVRR